MPIVEAELSAPTSQPHWPEHRQPTGARRPPRSRRPFVPREGDLAAHTAVLFLEAFDAGDERRRQIHDEVITTHLWLARVLARRCGGPSEDDEDLLQVARSGLVEAVTRFDPELGDFVAFAAPTIVGLLKRHFRDHGWLVRPPRHLQEVTSAIRREQPRLMQELGAEPSDLDLAIRLGESVQVIRQARGARAGYTGVSLDSMTGQTCLEDGAAVRARSGSEAEIMITKLLARLPDHERRLLRMRFGEQRSQADIAAELGVNQMQVSRRLSRLLRELRTDLGEIGASSSG